MIFFSFLGWGERTFNIVVCEKERKRRIFCGWKFFGRERKLGKEKKNRRKVKSQMKRKKGSPTISSQVSSFHCETHT